MMKFTIDIDVERVDGDEQERLDVGFRVVDIFRQYASSNIYVQGEGKKKQARYRVVYIALKEDGI